MFLTFVALKKAVAWGPAWGLRQQAEMEIDMKRSTVQDAMFPACPVRNVLARLCDKWVLLVIYILARSGEETMRFKDLKQQLPDISQRMLTMTLRTLEEDGYVTRTVFSEIPPRVEYALTARARSLMPVLDSLLQWAVDHMEDVMRDRKVAMAQPKE